MRLIILIAVYALRRNVGDLRRICSNIAQFIKLIPEEERIHRILDGLAPLKADSPRADSTPFLNPPLCHLYEIYLPTYLLTYF